MKKHCVALSPRQNLSFCHLLDRFFTMPEKEGGRRQPLRSLLYKSVSCAECFKRAQTYNEQTVVCTGQNTLRQLQLRTNLVSKSNKTKVCIRHAIDFLACPCPYVHLKRKGKKAFSCSFLTSILHLKFLDPAEGVSLALNST